MTLAGIPKERLLAAASLPENRGSAALLRRLAGETPSAPLRDTKAPRCSPTPLKSVEGPGQATGDAEGVRTPRGKAVREGLSSLRLTFYGAPRTKKNSAARLLHKGRPSIVPSEAWMRWRDECLKQVHSWMRLRDQRYNVAADFYRDADRGDATGFYQGLADVLQECGIVSDDRWLVTWDGSRLMVDREHPRVEISLSLSA